MMSPLRRVALMGLILGIIVVGAQGCDSSRTTEVSLDITGTVRDTSDAVVPSAQIYLFGVLLSTPYVGIILAQTVSDDGGEYAIAVTFPALRTDSTGTCIALAESQDGIEEIRVILTGSDGIGLYDEIAPQCVESQQHLDITLRPL